MSGPCRVAAYDAALTMITAIGNANLLNQQEITDSPTKIKATGVTGKIAFAPYGDLIKPSYTSFLIQHRHCTSRRTVGENNT
jgi:branched-chain amino acid transport system substrate-binding protein